MESSTLNFFSCSRERLSYSSKTCVSIRSSPGFVNTEVGSFEGLSTKLLNVFTREVLPVLVFPKTKIKPRSTWAAMPLKLRKLKPRSLQH